MNANRSQLRLVLASVATAVLLVTLWVGSQSYGSTEPSVETPTTQAGDQDQEVPDLEARLDKAEAELAQAKETITRLKEKAEKLRGELRNPSPETIRRWFAYHVLISSMAREDRWERLQDIDSIAVIIDVRHGDSQFIPGARDLVMSQLREAGVQISPGFDGYLLIRGLTVKHEGSPVYSYQVHVAFTDWAVHYSPEGLLRRRIFAEVYSIPDVIGYADDQSIETVLKEKIAEQVQVFIKDYLRANPRQQAEGGDQPPPPE